jgi:hypothetical protein
VPQTFTPVTPSQPVAAAAMEPEKPRPQHRKAPPPEPTRLVQAHTMRPLVIPLPRSARIPAPSPVARPFERRHLALAGLALALVAAGGTVVLLGARRQLRALIP